jgi:hypothetical protein
VAAEYAAQDEFVFLEDAIPAPLAADLLAEAQRARSLVHRVAVPFVRRGGSVSYFRLKERRSPLVTLYRSGALRGLVSRLAGRELQYCPEDDPHSIAVFYYDEAGDHVTWHVDACHYKRGVAYTVLMGLLDRSTSRLECRLGEGLPERKHEPRSYATGTGSLAIFNGCNVLHRVTPLGAGEERIVLSMQFLVDPRMNRARRFLANVDHAIKYFGLASLAEAARSREAGPPSIGPVQS